ncbi:MAG: precorrin-6y C5,15-methyltransferase (decarboxylating) subunit CbiE, partial [Sporomusaceae bacterium]|nr:precorrin-6y C5,15-methyltransferase (decarboxylating) subunit CbiE [Sporomusaceae bacterium]
IASVWQDATLVSLHGREAKRDVFMFNQCKKIAFLTDPVHCPSWIAAELIAGGWPLEAKVYLCEALSYQEEKIVSSTLQEVVKVAGFSHSVMVVTG